MKFVSRLFLLFFSVFLFLTSIFVSHLHSAVVLTHGALAQEDLWYRPGGSFFEALKTEGQNLGHESVSFSWDQSLGGLTHYERIKAGVELAKLVLDLAKSGEKEIILIGHSYGGHVIKAASQLLDDFIDDFSMYGVEPQLVTDPTSTSSLDTKSINEHQELRTAFLIAQKEVQEYKEKLELHKTKGQKDYFIDVVYTLGTPNDIPDYVANMNVIGSFYNFYSKGDLIQEIVGDILLPEPKHERAVNLSVQIKNDGWLGWGLPNHKEIHAEIIAKWILYIPFNLIEQKIGNFQQFSFDVTGNIFFSKRNPPVYSILDEDEQIGIVGQLWDWFLQWSKLNNYI